MDLTGKGGTVVATAVAPMSQTEVKLDLAMMTLSQKELRGTIFGSASPNGAIPELLMMYRQGRLKLDELITRRYSLDEINQGYQDMNDGKNIRGVIMHGLSEHCIGYTNRQREVHRSVDPAQSPASWSAAERSNSVVAALWLGSPPLLEGPPGTGKSTLLASSRRELGYGIRVRRGQRRTHAGPPGRPFRSGTCSQRGYDPDVWIDGPLRGARVAACCTSKRSTGFPRRHSTCSSPSCQRARAQRARLGRIEAAPGFRLVAAMNPFDAVGTARISGAVYDRVCRVGHGLPVQSGRRR